MGSETFSNLAIITGYIIHFIQQQFINDNLSAYIHTT